MGGVVAYVDCAVFSVSGWWGLMGLVVEGRSAYSFCCFCEVLGGGCCCGSVASSSLLVAMMLWSTLGVEMRFVWMLADEIEIGCEGIGIQVKTKQ